ncbi:YdcH family protein [Dokdonella sp. MW10]|uniref:YdcH family protein n=1 Tax=Dokdonella sp. MW10 TaxID=2992926 RepID=UPI003F7F4D8A
MFSEDPATTVRQLASLRVEHRELDDTIARLGLDPLGDELELKRLKKRKLRIKDAILVLESRLIPDLDA